MLAHVVSIASKGLPTRSLPAVSEGCGLSGAEGQLTIPGIHQHTHVHHFHTCPKVIRLPVAREVQGCCSWAKLAAAALAEFGKLVFIFLP